ncbi:hypothetical protein [Citrobacter braakii]|uniref:hypothetical protein n=1 Tax=Citrobacter braakii TaxID=57706 RepID=UPI004039F869
MVHATYEWLWTTIWVAISVIFTMPVAVIVLWIMLGRKKDELKARLAYLTFKEVVSDYFFSTDFDAENISCQEGRRI